MINENATYQKEIDLINYLAKFTEYLLDNGYPIEPLPNLEFKDGDHENAGDFFGFTAYYEPSNTTITLYTEGRHPKDIVRSYAHEMTHHMQHLRGELDYISTTDTNEDGDLLKLEKEAYLNGNISFRNWTDSITGNKGDMFGFEEFAREISKDINERKQVKQIQQFTSKLKDASKDQIKDFKSLPPLVKKWKREELSDEEQEKLKVLLVDLAKSIGIVVTYPVLGLAANALISKIINKLSKGKYSGLLPSKLNAVINPK